MNTISSKKIAILAVISFIISFTFFSLVNPLITNAYTILEELSITGDLKVAGESVTLGSETYNIGKNMVFDLNQGGSKVYDDVHLHVATDDYLFLDASQKVFVTTNLEVWGEVMADLFQGDLTGTVTGSLIGNATGLTGNPSITVTDLNTLGTITGDVLGTSTGLTGTPSISVNNLTSTGTITFPTNSLTDSMILNTITASNYLPLSGGTLSGDLTLKANLFPYITNTYDLGSNTKKWQDVYATTFRGDLSGNVTGEVTGGLTGNVTGNVSGTAGNLTGIPSISVSGLTMATGASNGYVLTTNGSGVASWTDVSSTSGPWTLNGTDLYPDDTSYNVGVGTTDPSVKLEVVGTSNTTQLIVKANATQSISNPLLMLKSSSGGELLSIHSDGAGSTFVGGYAGRSNSFGMDGEANTFIGYMSGYQNTTGESNTALGSSSLSSNTIGDYNTAIGDGALGGLESGTYNVAFGMHSLYNNISGSSNISLGTFSLLYNASGSNNIAIGYDAGLYNTSGSSNTFIGYQAGQNETGSNKLYIANGQYLNNTLIYGEFNTRSIKLLGNTTIASPGSLGSEKVANGYFDEVPDTYWTWGSGWTHDTVNFEADHTPGSTAALEQNVTAAAGEIYYISFAIQNYTAGSVTPQIGGVNGTAVNNSVYSHQTITATGTGNLKFTPTSDFDGSVYAVSVKRITGGNLAVAGLVTGGGTTGIKIDNTGNVGIGTTSPEMKLALDSDGGIMAKGTYGSGADLVTTGAGTRMFWYPKKAAFRAGKVDSTQWDDSNINYYSTAFGWNTIAKGYGSFAAGSNSTAGDGAIGGSDYVATAIGENAQAIGSYSFAFGRYVKASADGSFVFGYNGFPPPTYLDNTITESFMIGFSGTTPIFFAKGDGTDGGVGIGTTDPQSRLHVPDGSYAQFEDNNAGAPASADCDSDVERGRMSIDTSNNRLYICNGATRGWDYTALTD